MGEGKGGPKDGKVQGWQVGGMCQSSITRNLANNVFRERTIPWGGRECWVWTKKVFDQCPNELTSWDSYGRGLVATGMPNTGEREEKERGDIQPRTGFCRNGYVCPNGEVLGEMRWEVAGCL
jgi:hypothetical protein